MKSQANDAAFWKVIPKHCMRWGSFKGHIFYFKVYIVFDVDFVCNFSLLLHIFSNI